MLRASTPPEEQKTGPSKCRLCGLAIVWTLTARGKRMPVEAQTTLEGRFVLLHELMGDGRLHFRAQSVADVEAHQRAPWRGPRWRTHFGNCPKYVPKRRRPPQGKSKQGGLFKGGF